MLSIYNTLTKKKEIFEPINPPEVGMYICGPTVYDYFHIGNARSFVMADVVRRYLLYKGYSSEKGSGILQGINIRPRKRVTVAREGPAGLL